MIRISLPFVYQLASSLDPIEALPDQQTKYGEIWFKLYFAEQTVSSLISTSVYAPYLRSSQAMAQEFLQVLRNQTAQTFNADRLVEQYEFWLIKNTYNRYKIALMAELGVLASYFVTQKGGFDTATLLAFGEQLFPADLGAKVPEAIFDTKEAGKCLAFELPTAAGFHIFRVAESVLRKYYAHVTGGAAPPKVRSLGVYVHALRTAKKGDEKILSVLKQMTDLHRNPLIHPETVLTMDEALAIFGIARSAITAMLVGLPVVPPTTSVLGVPAPAAQPTLPGPSTPSGQPA